MPELYSVVFWLEFWFCVKFAWSWCFFLKEKHIKFYQSLCMDENGIKQKIQENSKSHICDAKIPKNHKRKVKIPRQK